MNRHTILYLPCFDFKLLPQRPQQLLWALADEGFDVVYCNITQEPAGEAFSALKPGFSICHNIQALDHKKPYIMWWTHGPYLEMLPEFNLEMLVSDIADATVEEFTAFNEWHQWKVKLGDLVFCASKMIYEETVRVNPHSFLVRNGVNPEFFAKALNQEQIPGEDGVVQLIGIAKTVVGFWGAVATWLDYELLSLLARSRPNYLFVLIGPIHAPEALRLQAEHSNILFTDYRPYYELPAWARYFNAAIIPFQVREVTRAANPIKMYEYLASGLPVIATDLPEVKECPLVRVAEDAPTFLQQLVEAVSAKSSAEMVKQRLDFAAGESWQTRARLIATKIRERLPEVTLRERGSWAIPECR